MTDATATAEPAPEAAVEAGGQPPDPSPVGPVTVEMSAEEVAAAAAAAKPAASGKGGKEAEGGKRKGKKARAAIAAGDGPSVAAHPRAASSIARAKSWGGLAGFFAAGYLSLPTYTLLGVGLRALLAGVVCYVAVWAGAVFVWRRLVVLEIKAREQQLLNEALNAAGITAASAGAATGAGTPRGRQAS